MPTKPTFPSVANKSDSLCPAAAFLFNEGAGSVAHEVVNGGSAIISGGATWGTGGYGPTLVLDGTGLITYLADAHVNGQTNMTVVAGFRHPTGWSTSVIEYFANKVNDYYLGHSSDGYLRIWYYSPNESSGVQDTVSQGDYVVVDALDHIVAGIVTSDAASNFYIDGSLHVQPTVQVGTAQVHTQANPLVMGGGLVGHLDFVLIYDRPLTSGDLATLQSAPFRAFSAAVVPQSPNLTLSPSITYVAPGGSASIIAIRTGGTGPIAAATTGGQLSTQAPTSGSAFTLQAPSAPGTYTVTVTDPTDGLTQSAEVIVGNVGSFPTGARFAAGLTSVTCQLCQVTTTIGSPLSVAEHPSIPGFYPLLATIPDRTQAFYAIFSDGQGNTSIATYDPPTIPLAIQAAIQAGLTVASVANLTGVNLLGGTVASSPAPTSTVFAATGLPSGLASGDLVGMSLVFQTGNRAGVGRPIIGHVRVGSVDTITLASALGAPPASGDNFLLGS